jgi:hypothetical protein
MSLVYLIYWIVVVIIIWRKLASGRLWTSSKAQAAAQAQMATRDISAENNANVTHESAHADLAKLSLGGDICHHQSGGQPSPVGFVMPVATSNTGATTHNAHIGGFSNPNIAPNPYPSHAQLGATPNSIPADSPWVHQTQAPSRQRIPIYPSMISSQQSAASVQVNGHHFGTPAQSTVGSAPNGPVETTVQIKECEAAFQEPAKMKGWQHAMFAAVLVFLLALVIAVSCVAALRGTYTKVYFIAAEEVTWDYGPSGTNGVTGKPFTDPSEATAALYMVKTDKLLGSKLKKVRFVEYTDGSFSTKKEVPAQVCMYVCALTESLLFAAPYLYY